MKVKITLTIKRASILKKKAKALEDNLRAILMKISKEKTPIPKTITLQAKTTHCRPVTPRA
jgi:hypothetical protein